MALSKRASIFLSVVTEKTFLKSFLSWPVFSFTSFHMLTSLSKQGFSINTVIDVGANVGQFAVAAAKIFDQATIYSFEPNPDCHKKFSQISARMQNIKFFPFALGDKDDELVFNINTHSHSSSFLPLAEGHIHAFPQASVSREITASVTTLDKMIESIDLKPPVLLKLDVQGFEANVLAGAKNSLQKIDYILIETSFKPMYAGEVLFRQILDLLENNGFYFLRPIDVFSNDQTGEILQMDALFERKL